MMLNFQKQNFYSSNLETNIENLQKGDWGSISWIFCVFAEKSPHHKERAAQALHEALERLSFHDICRVDMQMRTTTSMEWSINWRTLSLKKFMTKQMSEEERRAVLIFSSFNPNGYIRQQAVEQLASYRQSLPFLLLRLNDWVEPVRQSAATAFSERINVASDEEIVSALPFFEKLRKSERCDYTSIHSIMKDKFESNKTLIAKGLLSQEIRARRFCISTLATLPTADNAMLFAHIKNETDPFLRKMIFQILLKTNMDIQELSEQLLKDKYPPNRILALQSLNDCKPAIALAKAENMLLDKNAQVRLVARNMVAHSGKIIDFHQFYLDNLSDHTAVCLSGLGETGCAKDCPFIAKFLKDNRIAVIRAAMISLMRLDCKTFMPHITELLLSEHVGIVKTATLLLKKYRGYDFARVFEIQESSVSENTKMKCAALLFLASKWQSLIYTLMLTGSSHRKLEILCQAQIYKWIRSYNRSFLVASEQEKRTIETLIADKKNFLTPQIEKQLLFLSK